MLNNSTKTKSPDNWIYEYDKKLSCIDDTIYNGQVNSALFWDYQTKDDYTNCLQKAWQCDIAKCPLTNAECFNGCTYEEACADIRNYTPSCATNAECFGGLTCTEWQTYIDEHSGGLKCGWTIGYTCYGYGYPPSYNGICIYNCCCNSMSKFFSDSTDVDSPTIDMTTCVKKDNRLHHASITLWASCSGVDELEYLNLYTCRCINNTCVIAYQCFCNGIIELSSECCGFNRFCHCANMSTHMMRMGLTCNCISQCLSCSVYLCNMTTNICGCNRYYDSQDICDKRYCHVRNYNNYDVYYNTYTCVSNSGSHVSFQFRDRNTLCILYRNNVFDNDKICQEDYIRRCYSTDNSYCFTSTHKNLVVENVACNMLCVVCDDETETNSVAVCFLLKVSCSEPSALLTIAGNTATHWKFCCDGNLYKNGVCVL